MDKKEYIKALIEKYLDGETSNYEERALREYFANADNTIPEEWAAYKALFAYVDEEVAATEAATAPRRKAKSRLHFVIATSAAAVALVLAIVTYSYRRPANYVVIDGTVYTDRQTVTDEALEALQIVSSDCDDSFDALKLMQ